MRLISQPQIVADGFSRLQLSLPDGINNGGYIIPTPSGIFPSYSPIDLLVAGLSGEKINNMVTFFDRHRDKYIKGSDTIYLTLEDSGHIIHKTIPVLKIMCKENELLLRVLRRNAPLTFKWI